MTEHEHPRTTATQPSRRLIRLLAQDGRLPTETIAVGAPDVMVCSADEASRLRPSRRGVIIALRDPGSSPVQLRTGWLAVLALEVQDVNARGDLEPPVDLTQAAAAVAEFVSAHRSVARIVLHCHLGVSRSRSTAAALCESFGWPYHWTVLHEPLYRAVLAACRQVRSAGNP
jgi:rhodanese-related sulfurtransferase